MNENSDIVVKSILKLKEERKIDKKQSVISFQHPYYVAAAICDNRKKLKIWSTKTGEILKTIEVQSIHVDFIFPHFVEMAKWSSKSVLVNLGEENRASIAHYEIKITDPYEISKIDTGSSNYILTKSSQKHGVFLASRIGRTKTLNVYIKSEKVCHSKGYPLLGIGDNGLHFSALHPNSIYIFIENKSVLRLMNYKSSETIDFRLSKRRSKVTLNCITSFMNKFHEEIVVVGGTIKGMGYRSFNIECLMFYNSDTSIQNLKNRVKKKNALIKTLVSFDQRFKCLCTVENRYLITGGGSARLDNWDIFIIDIENPEFPKLKKMNLHLLFPKVVSGRADFSIQGIHIVSRSRFSCDILHFTNYRIGVVRITGLELHGGFLVEEMRDLEERIKFLRLVEEISEEGMKKKSSQVIEIRIYGNESFSNVFKSFLLM